VPRIALSLDSPFEPRLVDGTGSGLVVEAFAVPGKPAWYLEGTEDGSAPDEGDTIGLRLSDRRGGKACYFIAGCAEMTPELAARLEGAELLFFDGTLWRDDEMIRAGLGHKTGQRMGHMPMSGGDGSMQKLADLGVRRKIFVHINNSNPVLLPDSAERREAEAAGWCIPAPGMEVAI